MKKLLILLMLFLSFTTVASESMYLRTYSSQPCDFWSFDGRCNSHFNRYQTPEAYSLMRIIDRLEARIISLENQVYLLKEDKE